MLDRIIDNPILVKHTRSRLRRPKTLPAVAGLMLLCICIMW